ncbi:MAG: EamA family transporter, partial [Candidatus Competibacteraceae bacterium]|nr:EamA family transporter [Candidatus Competibacteraceae bacterium]
MTNKDLLLALIVNIFWAFNFVAAKYGLAHFPAFLFTALRFLLLLILLAPLLRPVPGHTRRLLLIGLVMGIGHFSLMFWGMSVSSDVSSIAIASQLYVPFSTLLAVLFLSETIRWRR